MSLPITQKVMKLSEAQEPGVYYKKDAKHTDMVQGFRVTQEMIDRKVTVDGGKTVYGTALDHVEELFEVTKGDIEVVWCPVEILTRVG